MTELYPLIEPYDQGLLDVGDGTSSTGRPAENPDGKQAVMVHAARPGLRAGHAADVRPLPYRAVLFDQRGCGRAARTPATRAPAWRTTPPTTWCRHGAAA